MTQPGSQTCGRDAATAGLDSSHCWHLVKPITNLSDHLTTYRARKITTLEVALFIPKKDAPNQRETGERKLEINATKPIGDFFVRTVDIRARHSPPASASNTSGGETQLQYYGGGHGI